MLTFVLILSRDERPIAGQLLAHISRFERRELAFIADQHLKWTSPDRRISLNAWQSFAEQGQVGSYWRIADSRVTLFNGVPYRPGHPWTPGIDRATQIATRIDEIGPEAMAAELHGAFTIIDVQYDRPGVLVSDLEGVAPLYSHLSDDIVILSNRAGLVANLIPRDEDEPQRDWRGPATTVFAGVPVGPDTGFAGVSVSPRGKSWTFGTGQAAEERMSPPVEPPVAASSEASETIEQLLRDTLRAAVDLPYQRHRLMLDGGLGSRLLLGLALDEGFLDRLTLSASGSPDDPAVKVAISLAQLVDRPIEILPSTVPTPASFERQAQLHLFQTSGIGSLWSLRGLLAADDVLSIDATGAGLVAPDARVRRFLRELAEPSGQPLFDPYTLLSPDASAHIDAIVGAQLMEPSGLAMFAAGPGAVRPLIDVPEIARVFPFLDANIWSVMETLDFEDFADGALGRDILERTAPALLGAPIEDEPSSADSRVLQFAHLFPLFDDTLMGPFNPLLDEVQIGPLSALLTPSQTDPDAIRTLYDLLTIGMWLEFPELRQRVHRADERGVWGEFSPLDYEPSVIHGDAARIPEPNEAVRNPATDQLRDARLKMDGPGHPLGEDARVLGVIPHYKAGSYLRDAIESLLEQTRPLQGIVVIDDHSPTSPEAIVSSYPGVTLLRAQARSGPYRMIQTLFENVDYDAFLLQDADDWSTPQRLELQLEHAVVTGQEQVGGQYERIFVAAREAAPLFHPFNAAEAQVARPTTKSIIHGTALISESLIKRAGGFSSGLLFGGDTEFLRRAVRVGKIGNTREYTYFYRMHSGSLTGSDETGMHTPARQTLQQIQHNRANWNAARVAARLEPMLAPMSITTPARLQHVCGPALTGRNGSVWPTRVDNAVPFTPKPLQRATSQTLQETTPRPIFIIGARFSATGFLAVSLTQHQNLMLLTEPGWIARAAVALRAIHTSAEQARKINDLHIGAIGAETFAAHFGHSISELLLHGPESEPGDDLDCLTALARRQRNRKGATRLVGEGNTVTANGYALHLLFPQARFVHVLRDPDDVIQSMQIGLPRTRTIRFAENRAYDEWCDDVRAATTLEAALGSDVVLRVDHADLMGDPEATLRTIFDFIEESWDPVVLRPFL